MMMRIILPALLLLALAGPAQAKLYRWVDDAGITHFSDNPANVPPAKRGHAEVQGMPELNVVDSRVVSSGGSSLFDQKCGACHVAGYDADGERLPLLSRAYNPETGLKRTVEELASELRWAADGRYSDMPAVEVSDEDLEKIAGFLLQRATNGR